MVDLKNICVLAYIIIGYATGIYFFLFGDQSFWALLVGTALITHVITWSAFVHHELCHNSVFDQAKWNLRCGCVIDWINGACYWTFDELKKQHINHHIYKVDYDISSSYLKWIEERKLAKQLFCMCEYFYFPVNAYITQCRSILSPWWKDERKAMRMRTFIVICIRLIYFMFLYYFGGLSVILCYILAYSISIQITRFTDAFSHDYEVVAVGSPRKNLSKQYDMLHTYSIVWQTNKETSRLIRYLAEFTHLTFFLNFNFHNQHHYATQKKWFQLGSSFQSDNNASPVTAEQAKIGEQLTDKDNNADEFIMNHQPEEKRTISNNYSSSALCGVPNNHYTIPMLEALWAFHTHRVTRLFSNTSKPILDPITEQLSLHTCYGVTDASLLTLEV